MMNERKKRRPHWSVWLLYAVIVTALVGTATLSRYMNSISGTGRGSVANWQIDITNSPNAEALSIVQGSAEGASCSFSIRNNSEVTALYTVTVSGVPRGVSVSLNSGTAVASETDGAILELTAARLATGESADCTLTFTAAADASLADAQSVSISVLAEQVD